MIQGILNATATIEEHVQALEQMLANAGVGLGTQFGKVR
jgi:hypothetical protein